MSYKVSFEDRGTYLYVRLEGLESFQSAELFCQNMAERLENSTVNKILIVDNVKHRLSTLELHQLGELVSSLFLGNRIAFVDPREENYKDNKFGETVVQNRGGQIVKLFQSEESGLKWLFPTPTSAG